MTNGRFRPRTRAGDRRSLQPFLRELEALCRRRGFILEGGRYETVVVKDLDQDTLPGSYQITHQTREWVTIHWTPGRTKKR